MMLMMVVVGVVAQLVLQLMCSDCSISVYGSKTVALAVIESLWLLVSEHGDGVTEVVRAFTTHYDESDLLLIGNMKSQTGSSVGDHCVPVKKTKVTVSKSPCMPPPKAAVSKAAKKSKVVNSTEPKEVETVASESSDTGDSDSDHIEAATTDVVLSPTRKRKRTSKYWAEF
ncbi:hypothetical protein C5167_031042, partial [Papaver somniferum]